MIQLELKGKTIELPSSWGDVKLGDYERWFMREPKGQMEYVQFVADICKVEAEVLLESPAHVFEAIVGAISFIAEQNFEPANLIQIDGERYSVAFSDSLTLAEWVDVEAILESESDAKILAVLCRPAGEKYETRVADVRKEVYRNLSCDKVLPLIAFFCRKKDNPRQLRTSVRR